MALQAIKEIDHDLQKASCYKAWLPAADYQVIFNERIKDLRKRLLEGMKREAIEIDREIQSIEPRRWIMEADRILKNRVRHPARELMEKYITEQTRRLQGLTAIKRRIGSDQLISYLEGRSKPFKERLMKERTAQINPPEEVARVYRKVAEGVL